MTESNESFDRPESGLLSDYTVGHQRPPLHTRFKPGVSGIREDG